MGRDIVEVTKKYRVTAILRGIGPDRIEGVIDALHDGGIRLLEITFDQRSATKLEDTAAAIRYARDKYADEMYVGAGTVMKVDQLIAAKDAGAEFVLSPNVDLEVIHKAVELGIAAIPGAMTPSEIATAFDAGASIVKLFPAGNLGIAYCKAVMAPISHVPMIAVGGVDDHNLGDFLATGFIGAGIGSNLTNKKMIAEADWAGIKALAQRYIAAAGL